MYLKELLRYSLCLLGAYHMPGTWLSASWEEVPWEGPASPWDILAPGAAEGKPAWPREEG